jgi:hypothetical protein
MLTTSLQRLFECGSWVYQTKQFDLLMKHFGATWKTIDDSEISFSDILELTDLEYVIDCTSSRIDLHKTWREFSVWCCEPLAYYITLPSCKIALDSANKFINDEISIDELSYIFQLAYDDQSNDISDHLSLSYCANRIAMDSANPQIDTCITNCFNTSALGMDRLGLQIKSFESMQRAKFIALVS